MLRSEAEILNEVARVLTSELDLQTLVQKVTDAGTELTAAKFGAFFYNTVDDRGESYLLYTLSGAPREDFEKAGIPRNTPLFEPTFRGEGVVRIDDVLQDPRYGRNPPHHGMPIGHPPVRSYLAVPVMSRSGTVLGGLLFGHPEPSVFTERAERLALGFAAQAAIAIDNARLYGQARTEIRERIRAESALRMALEAGRMGTWEWSIASGRVAWSPGLEEIHGRESGSFSGTFEDVLSDIHPEDRERFVATVRSAVDAGVGYHLEYRIVTRHGEERWLEARGTLYRDEAGRPERIAGVCMDVTDRKRAEHAVLESEQRYRRLVQGLPAAVYMTDAEGRITLYNDEAVALWGRAPQLGVDQWCGSWRTYRPDGTLLPHDECPMAVTLKEGRPVRGQEVLVERPDGTRRHVVPHPEPIHDASGRLVGAFNMLVDVTEHQRAEATRVRLAAIIETSDDAIISKTLDGAITSWNAGAARIFGYTAEEAIGKPITFLIPEERLAEEQDILARLRRGERVDHFETVRVAKDGRRIDVSETISPLHDSDGRIFGASKIARDVTLRKRAERERAALRDQLAAELEGMVRLHQISTRLTQHDDLHTLLPEVMDAAITITGADMGNIRLFDGATGRLQIVAQRGFDQHLIDFFNRGSNGRQAWEAAWDSGERLIVEDIAQSPMYAGTAALDVLLGAGVRAVQFTPLVRRSGRVLGVLATHYRHPYRPTARDLRLLDLLARQATDLIAKAKAEDELRESEQRFRLLADSAPVLIWMSDAETRGVYFSQPWLAFVGLPLETQLGDGWLQAVHVDDRAALHEQRQAMLRQHRSFTTQFRLRRFDGEHRWMLDTGAPRFAPDGSFLGSIGTCIDITDIKRSQEELKEAKDSAEAANRSKDKFLAVLSHELRTPLTPVLMAAAAMEGNPELPAAVREDIAMVRRNVELETRLIDDLLDISRITSGKIQLQPQSVDLNTAVRHVCEVVRAPMLEKGLRLHCDFGETIGVVFADPARLQQILWNVLKNAAKFTPEGGDIYVSTAGAGNGRARVTVRDTGIGIDAETLPRVFDAFEQGSIVITQQFGGLGLGLAISKALVELQNGSISAASDGNGRGATFTVELPADASVVHRQTSPTAPQPAVTDARLRVLIVEDHADTAKLLARLLRLSGYTVETADRVADALELAARGPFDVLISDVGLPDGTGYELMQRIRERYTLTGIAMSGYGMDEDIRKSREAGFIEHLVKPVDVAQLEQAIRRVRNPKGE